MKLSVEERQRLRLAINHERRLRVRRELLAEKDIGPRCPGVSQAGRACRNQPRFPAEAPTWCGVHRHLGGER